MVSDPTPREVELSEFERIVGRGVQRQTWAVRVLGRWVPAAKVNDAFVLDCPRTVGVVWQRLIRVRLLPGVRLLSTVERPQTAKPRDVFSVITVDARAAIRVQKTEFCVTPDGKLERVKPT
jgi:hypothetical protein